MSVVPPENCTLVGRQYGFQLASPVHLQLPIARDVIGLHEVLDGRTLVPASRRNLVPSQVDKGRVREKLADFLDYLFRQGEHFGHGNVKLAVISRSSRTLDADAFGLPNCGLAPSPHVSRGIDLRYDLNCIHSRSGQNLADIARSVNLRVAVFAGLSQFRVRDQEKGERLIIDDVPVQHVEFGQRHGIDESNDAIDTQEMPGGIDHDPPILQQRRISDVRMGYSSIFDNLGERFQGVDVA